MAQPATQHDPGRQVDWEAIERSPEFQELERRKRAFVLPGTVFFLAWYMGFILLTAYAEDFMARSVYQGLTVGYCLALTQFLMVLVLGILYLRRSATVFDPLAERARAAASSARAPRAPSVVAPPRRPRGPSDDRLRGGQHHGDRRLRHRPRHHARHHLLGVQAGLERGRLLCRGPGDHRPPERPRDLRRLPVRRLVPGHRGPHLHLRLR